MKNTVTNKIIGSKLFGFAKYIVVKVTKSNTFYLAQYASSQTDRPIISLANFTGRVSLRNLENNEISFYDFINGKKNIRVNADENNSRSTACVTTYTCNWYNWNCGGVYVSLTMGQDFCPPPPFNPCGQATWEISDSKSETTCNQPDDSVILIPAATFNSSYVISGPEKPINNLSARLNCLLAPRIPSHRYANVVTIYVDQPVANTNQLFSLSASYRRTGHAYFSLEVQDATANTRTRLVFGFYVKNEWRAVAGLNSASAWGEDGNTPYDVSITTTIGTAAFNELVTKLQKMGNPTYQIVDNNCVSMIYGVFGNIFAPYNGGLPDSEQQIGPLGRGKTPSQFGQSLREQWSANGEGRTYNLSHGAKSPVSTNCN